MAPAAGLSRINAADRTESAGFFGETLKILRCQTIEPFGFVLALLTKVVRIGQTFGAGTSLNRFPLLGMLRPPAVMLFAV